MNRKTVFTNGEFYHIYNRGVDKRDIFLNQDDFDRFFQSMNEFNTIDPIGSIYQNSFNTEKFLTKDKKPLVNFIAFCLNSNHFHFILEQVTDGGISEFMKRIGGGYASYFNNKEKRTGSLFQGRFKSIHINSNEYLLHLSAYVNLNYKVHTKLSGPIPKHSSWTEYTKNNLDGIFCKKDIILEQFKNNQAYKVFAEESIEWTINRRKEMKLTEKLLLE